jgi:patched 1 protein
MDSECGVGIVKQARVRSNWTLADMCFKPPPPRMAPGMMTTVVAPMVEQIIPCILITPLDCFWDGAKPLGPLEPISIPSWAGTLMNLPPTSIGLLTWKNLRPKEIMDAIARTGTDMGMIGTQLRRIGLGEGYVRRPCIDPYAYDCPDTAPNKVDVCGIVDAYHNWMSTNPLGAFELAIDDVLPDKPGECRLMQCIKHVRECSFS